MARRGQLEELRRHESGVYYCDTPQVRLCKLSTSIPAGDGRISKHLIHVGRFCSKTLTLSELDILMHDGMAA